MAELLTQSNEVWSCLWSIHSHFSKTIDRNSIHHVDSCNNKMTCLVRQPFGPQHSVEFPLINTHTQAHTHACTHTHPIFCPQKENYAEIRTRNVQFLSLFNKQYSTYNGSLHHCSSFSLARIQVSATCSWGLCPSGIPTLHSIPERVSTCCLLLITHRTILTVVMCGSKMGVKEI